MEGGYKRRSEVDGDDLVGRAVGRAGAAEIAYKEARDGRSEIEGDDPGGRDVDKRRDGLELQK